MTTIYIGTSGWSYDWNIGNSLSWYIAESRLNAIELNMSFYRFPYPNMVKSWAAKGTSLAWVVKVHRSITHFQKLSTSAVESFQRFKKLFAPLEELIHYYLFQLPPSFTDITTLEQFIEKTGTEKLAIEFRHPTLFTNELIEWGKKHGILLVSIDAPQFPLNHHEPGCCLRANPWSDWVVLPQLFRSGTPRDTTSVFLPTTHTRCMSFSIIIMRCCRMLCE